jgi:hypothetical protein
MTSELTDLARTARDIGTGALLSRSAYRLQTAHSSRLKPGVYYGMGLIRQIAHYLAPGHPFS